MSTIRLRSHRVWSTKTAKPLFDIPLQGGIYNLAWNLAEKGGNIDEALTFARIAKEQMPKNTAVMDTLGWIYYQKGSYLNAVEELQDSVEGNSENPVIHYHLGLAYYKNNKADPAREYLARALELDPNFKGADDARKVLSELKG